MLVLYLLIQLRDFSPSVHMEYGVILHLLKVSKFKDFRWRTRNETANIYLPFLAILICIFLRRNVKVSKNLFTLIYYWENSSLID